MKSKNFGSIFESHRFKYAVELWELWKKALKPEKKELELRFDQLHLIQGNQVEFKHRKQKSNKSFQEYEVDVGRLAQPPYPGVANDIHK